MKSDRHGRILEIIRERSIETQEELAQQLREEGYEVTQATISRDIRQLGLTKVVMNNGHQKYVSAQNENSFAEKYVRILKEAFISADTAQNLAVIRTASGMAMAVGAAIDAMHFSGFVGCIGGDDTVMVALKTNEEAEILVKDLRKIVR
jgi:transcriptional regulator of arginine metabolism